MHLDDLLHDWPFQSRTVSARLVAASDGRDVLQMRVDLGVLQMEVTGRPDGTRPGGAETLLDWLLKESFHQGDRFEWTEQHLDEIDREFSQFYHRRICWMAVQKFDRAAVDAGHTLALLDFLQQCPGDQDAWLEYEQLRPLALFHQAQTAALAHLESQQAEPAIETLARGLDALEPFAASEHLGSEPQRMIDQLQQLQDWVREEYRVDRTLAEQLADAVADEQFEAAARIRDEIARRSQRP
jgi:hypothetical protein